MGGGKDQVQSQLSYEQQKKKLRSWRINYATGSGLNISHNKKQRQHFTLCESSTPVLLRGLSREWLQISSGFQVAQSAGAVQYTDSFTAEG